MATTVRSALKLEDLYLMQAPTINQQIEFQEHSIPIWPTQLRRYTQITMPDVIPHHNYNVEAMQTDWAQSQMHGDWEELDHPSGAIYHYNPKTESYAEINMREFSDAQLQRLESWIKVSRSKLNGRKWLLVVEPLRMRGIDIYTYYYVVPERRVIAWLEPVDGYILFQECTTDSNWKLNTGELKVTILMEANVSNCTRKHVEYFPHGIDIPLQDVRTLHIKLNWYRVEASTMEHSMAASIFWKPDEMKEMAAELAARTLQDMMELWMEHVPSSMTFPDRIFKGHHEYLNHHGQPEARLMRMHSVTGKCGPLKKSPFLTGAAVAMFWIPFIMLDRLKHVYVDGLINGVDIRRFTDDFSTQAKAQTTVASVIMAVNASILAVPGLGTQLATKALCSISFVLCVYCIVGCMIAQQLVQRLRYLDFSAYYLQEEMGTFAILASIPMFTFLMSLAFAIIGVLAGIFTVGFGLPLSTRIGCGLILIVGGGLVIPLTMASFGPGLIQ
ncbi:uncharacterized protein F5147DRAFT_788278 [Suillus discolor]|uniref:Uncharacterized protein n=1 Tax=Suillus discolor TaxID=1912936 RepID=A0A9P7ET67_9AGAM|nr:uncharacterized protein F5147DRAFT_788278 [Suillus discolor]KAG2089635.1 hypothetical protein F5147DRAFT_788278 [Suillus discolor]